MREIIEKQKDKIEVRKKISRERIERKGEIKDEINGKWEAEREHERGEIVEGRVIVQDGGESNSENKEENGIERMNRRNRAGV